MGGRRSAEEHLEAHRFGRMVSRIAKLPGFFLRPMFGCLACYVQGRLVLVLADRTEPWCGVMLPAERPVQAALREAHPALGVHPVLAKWLYVSIRSEHFDETVAELVEAIVSGDFRYGVIPEPKRMPRWKGPAVK